MRAYGKDQVIVGEPQKQGGFALLVKFGKGWRQCIELSVQLLDSRVADQELRVNNNLTLYSHLQMSFSSLPEELVDLVCFAVDPRSTFSRTSDYSQLFQLRVH